MTRAFALLIAAALAGCGPGASEAPVNRQSGDGPMNRQDGDKPARRVAQESGPCIGPITDEALANCDFGPAERMRGVWVTGFERSEYVPGGTGGRAEGDPGPPRAWLAFAPGAYPDPALRAELDGLRATAAVDIEFIGRRARPPGAVVVVDRIISARSLGPVRAD
ncbi:MAG TPA: hypothetical protein VGO55_14610 [Allosphingosinicella sp.]|jgi:hypothetical protein|nr:hypothetical protein [Allosphingosinicella sp.]